MNPFNEQSNWAVLQPDALGSLQEGWSVGNTYDTGRVITLDDFENDIEVVEALQRIGFIPSDVEAWQVDIDGDENEIILSDASNYQPLFQLARTERIESDMRMH